MLTVLGCWWDTKKKKRHLLRMRSFDALTHQCSYDEVEECVGEIADLFDMRTNCGRLLCGVSACCCPVRNPWGQVALAEYTEGLARCLFNNGRLMDLLWQRACWRYQVALHGGADVLLSPWWVPSPVCTCDAHSPH